ncbi:hypothetical protein SAMN06265222_10331 [Neorhodopirellula lusitana]|uniref:Uncharacterized protein n=1 Tax=Neorhodopirellula lusitana TaxID=445327 RepID=A0ABY1PX81_9BACT|nr:hypothetical protein [Neorhodopirellula lusitana]SMP50038.1 hypothetical protein SAMN06265222_10331 [Neorhodopirellula lusitana]
MPHRIRLRHPWTQQPHSESGADSDAKKQITFTRRFNRPTGLTANDSVELEVNAQQGTVDSIRLNATTLTSLDSTKQVPAKTADNLNPSETVNQSIRVELSKHLEDHNELEVTLYMINGEPQLGEVILWIKSD